jgi:DNA-binding transcriptional LysR family regulator
MIEDGSERRAFVSRASWRTPARSPRLWRLRAFRAGSASPFPDTYSALVIASRSDMAALIPVALALMSAQSGRVKLIDPPYESPNVDLTLLFLKERLAEPAIAWMRDVIRAGRRQACKSSRFHVPAPDPHRPPCPRLR